MEAAQPELGLAALAGDGTGEAVELVVERRFVHPRRRCDVGPEDAHLDPPEPTQGADAAALARRRVDRRPPVDGDAELARPEPPPVAVGGEDGRDLRERGRAPIEELPRVRRREPADVDSADVHAVREPGR